MGEYGILTHFPPQHNPFVVVFAQRNQIFLTKLAFVRSDNDRPMGYSFSVR